MSTEIPIDEHGYPSIDKDADFLVTLSKSSKIIKSCTKDINNYKFNLEGFSEEMLDGASHLLEILVSKDKFLTSVHFANDTIEGSAEIFKYLSRFHKIVFDKVAMTKPIVQAIAAGLPTMSMSHLDRECATISFKGCNLTDELLEILAPHLQFIQDVHLEDNPALTKEGYASLIKYVLENSKPEMREKRKYWLLRLYVDDGDMKKYLTNEFKGTIEIK